MVPDSKLEHLWDMGMPKEKKKGLLRKPKPMTKKDAIAENNRDNRKTSIRKASEVPGAANKHSSNRNG